MRLTLAVPAAAALMLLLSLAPGEIWSHPITDQTYAGFDPNLTYKGDGGFVQVSRDKIEFRATSSSQPAVNLLTTSLRRFNASLDVVIVEANAAVVPFRIGVWSPWSQVGYFVIFQPAPVNLIAAESWVGGTPSTTLVGGVVADRVALGHYDVGARYHVSLTVDKSKSAITVAVSNLGARLGQNSIGYSQLPAIFSARSLSLTASALAGVGTSHVVLEQYMVTLPHATAWANAVNDQRAKTAITLLTSMAVLLICISLVRWLHNRPRTVTAHGLVARLQSLRSHVLPSGWTALWSALLFVYLIGNVSLFRLGGHPFDMGNEKLFAYVARAYGPDQLYYLPNLVSLPKIWAGVPYSESAFPYEPILAYFFTAIGWLGGGLLAGGGAFRLSDVRLEYVIKGVNVLFGLADATLIYLILHQVRVSVRWSGIAAGLFLFNPAVWFSTSVWGQNHVFSIFLALIAVLMAEKEQPLLAWLALAAACLTRPQMLVFGLVLGLVFFRRFSWRLNLWAVSWTVILVFVALTPLMLDTGPSLPVDITLANLRIQEASGNSIVTVSQGAYSIWPLVTYMANGASGLQRAFTPSSAPVLEVLTYQRVSQILIVIATLAVCGAVLFRNKAMNRAGGYLPFVALGITSFLMLTTGSVATYFLLALPFLLLSRPWMGTLAYFYVAIAWTIFTFVPMFGDMGVVISSQDYPLLAPAHNAVTRFFIQLYSWDRFITLGVSANICAVLWLAFSALRPTTDPKMTPVATR